MKRIFVLLLTFYFFSGFIQNSNSGLQNTGNFIPKTENRIISLIFAGDIMGHSPQYHAAYNSETKTYNYDICFYHVKSCIESADFAVANLEVPLAGTPYSGYPNFSSPDALLDGIKNAGFDVVLTANNHVFDRGKAGHNRTVNLIKTKGLKFAGSYTDKNQRDSIYPLIIEKYGLKIALLNCTYGTNGNNITAPNVVNMLDTLEIKKDINTAKKLNADVIIMTVHWGVEYNTKSDEIQRHYAKFFVRQGVNIVIGSHPHVVQNVDFLYNNDSTIVPVFYSLGNFISNQRQPETDGGIVLRVLIGSESKKIIETSYSPVYVHKGILDGKFQFHLIPTVDFVRNPSRFSINNEDSTALTIFDKKIRLRLSNVKLYDLSENIQ